MPGLPATNASPAFRPYRIALLAGSASSAGSPCPLPLET